MLSYGCCHVKGYYPPPRFLGKICCPEDVVMSQDIPFLFYYGENMLSNGCCQVTRHSFPLFYYGENMLSYECCHVTGHKPPVFFEKYVVLCMLSCHRTFPSCFIMGKICCPMDVKTVTYFYCCQWKTS